MSNEKKHRFKRVDESHKAGDDAQIDKLRKRTDELDPSARL